MSSSSVSKKKTKRSKRSGHKTRYVYVPPAPYDARGYMHAYGQMGPAGVWGREVDSDEESSAGREMSSSSSSDGEETVVLRGDAPIDMSEGGMLLKKKPNPGMAVLDEDVLLIDELKLAVLRLKRSEFGKALYYMSPKVQQWIFMMLLLAFQLVIIAVYGVWMGYVSFDLGPEEMELYPFFRDVAVMIFFGFGLLMTFMRRFGFSAVGYTMLFSALSVEWSVILGKMMQKGTDQFESTQHIEILSLLEGLFAAAAVMITYGAVLGKVTPLMMLLITFVEPILFWANFYVGALELEAHDVGGGMWIHMFGAFFGLPIAWWLTLPNRKSHPDATSWYTGDILAMTGTFFLWIMWPSFNAAVAAGPANGDYGTEFAQYRAIVNTVLSLCAATVATFVFSGLSPHAKFAMEHVQNATLAGGVVMGTCADLDMHPASALASGFIAGTISVLGYRFLSPFLHKWLFLGDSCGVLNLHGIPGLLGAILTIFVTWGECADHPDRCAQGKEQPAYQLAAIAITLGISLTGGIVVGFLCFLLKLAFPTRMHQWYNDRLFWETPSDYATVVTPAVEAPGYLEDRVSRVKALAKRGVAKGVEKGKELYYKIRKDDGDDGDDDDEASNEEDVEMTNMHNKSVQDLHLGASSLPSDQEEE